MVPGASTGGRLEPQQEMASWALERWAEFPVGADPRPWVFTGPVVRPDGGFRTGEAKLSFLRGDVTATFPIPRDVLGLVRQNGAHVGGRTQSLPLVITGASRSEADFLTDRGEVPFPAWGLEADEVNGRIWVIDPRVVARQWKPTEPEQPSPPFSGGLHRSFRSTLEYDGQTLHFEFTGGAPEHVEYPDAVVIESDQAVAVIPIVNDIGPPGPQRARGYRREVVVRLREMLGARVLVNLDASPVVVLV